ncbi:unnamed protein product [Caenorhabditis auriculariae]|uniref:Uncharacterized protein n=1 Tax=Caenorhabditis auriculariae TaxID=2777116 RepID=A0A8S1HSP5_9PELO|nr:unnamed protein product [Caenorhabditis auriculariae]
MRARCPIAIRRLSKQRQRGAVVRRRTGDHEVIVRRLTTAPRCRCFDSRRIAIGHRARMLLSMRRLWTFSAFILVLASAEDCGPDVQSKAESTPPTVKLTTFQVYQNPSTGAQTYFTGDKCVENVPGFPKRMTDARWGMIAPTETVLNVCPDLVKIYSVTNGDVTRLITGAEVPQNPKAVFIGFAGSWPGYCKSTNAPLVEFFSSIKNQYLYVTNIEDMHALRVDRMYEEFRPTRVLGYLYKNQDTVTLEGPWGAPQNSVVYGHIPVPMNPIRRVFKANALPAYTTDPTSMKVSGFVLDDFVKSQYSLIQPTVDISQLEPICGPLVLLHETYNKDFNGVYRIRNLNSFPLMPVENIVRKSGYLFKDQNKAKDCVGYTAPVFEYQQTGTGLHFIAVDNTDASQYAQNNNTYTWTATLGYASYGSYFYTKDPTGPAI